MAILRKYPVTYEGQEYEVRWEGISNGFVNKVSLYKVEKVFFFFKMLVYCYSLYDNAMLKDLGISIYQDDIYIKEAEYLLKSYVNKIEQEQKYNDWINDAEKKLKEWDGIVK